MNKKILSNETQQQALIDKIQWNDLIRRIFSTQGRTIRFLIEEKRKIKGVPRLGTVENQDLGIKINHNQIDATLDLNKILSFGIYDGSNLDNFDGVITKERLAEWSADENAFKIAFSIGKTETGEVIVLVDLVDGKNRLHGGGVGGEGLVPCRIPAP